MTFNDLKRKESLFFMETSQSKKKKKKKKKKKSVTQKIDQSKN